MGSINYIPKNDIYHREDVEICCASEPLRFHGCDDEGYKIALWCLECGECSEACTNSIEKYCIAADAAVIHWNNRIKHELMEEYRI